eukprot:CAMPEP_0117436038 /NCGR_PEP_ID=MMETSP0759-20121206/801_1 /TAXON_ID=63605 /ORGANISM="Percolomonas cosmopolitus, Strain WS" /LENGTH=670 /DNA_ID=CAMNT_0005227625 /DNA_START=823 /DNA_END=2835 /DNA_ORIENTATION=-
MATSFQRYFREEIENDEVERNSLSVTDEDGNELLDQNGQSGKRRQLSSPMLDVATSRLNGSASAPAKASGIHEYENDHEEDMNAFRFPASFDDLPSEENESPQMAAAVLNAVVNGDSDDEDQQPGSMSRHTSHSKRKRLRQTSRLEPVDPNHSFQSIHSGEKKGSPLTNNTDAAQQRSDDESKQEDDKKASQPPPLPPKAPPNPHLQLIKNTLTSAWRKFDKALSVDPNSSKKRVWNMFALLVVTLNCTIVPLRMGWGQHQLWWIPIDLLTDLVTLIDMFLFSISMYVKDGAKVHEFRFTVRHYVFSWYFLFDALSIIPIDIIGWFVGGYSFFRLNRMLRLTREKYYFETIEELFPQIKPTIIRLLRSIVFTLNCAHFIACSFFLITSSQGEGVMSVDFIPGKVFLLRMNPWAQYIRCFYWALVTMTGYQNTQPQTNIEVAFSLCVSAVGLSLYITIIGTVGSLMSNLDASKQYFISRMDQINAFMNFRELPNDMQEQIREYYTYLWKSRRSLNESNVFIDLPMHLQIEVAMKLNEKFIKKVDIFQGAEQQFIERIVVKMKPKLALPNVFIVRQGEIGREMYLISKGEVEVVLGNGLIVATLPEGKIFGEIALLENCRRNASIRAKSHCDLFVLSKKDFTDALEAFPLQKERVADLARRKKEETAAKNKK